MEIQLKNENNKELTEIRELNFIEIPKLNDNRNEKYMSVAWTEFLKKA